MSEDETDALEDSQRIRRLTCEGCLLSQSFSARGSTGRGSAGISPSLIRDPRCDLLALSASKTFSSKRFRACIAFVRMVRRCQEDNDLETSRMLGICANVRSTCGAQTIREELMTTPRQPG